MSFLEWLCSISRDADPARAGFQASWIYVAWNVAVPAAIGLLTALVAGLLQKLFGSGPAPDGEG